MMAPVIMTPERAMRLFCCVCYGACCWMDGSAPARESDGMSLAAVSMGNVEDQ